MRNRSFVFFVILFVFLSFLSLNNYLKKHEFKSLQKEVAEYFRPIPNAEVLSMWETGVSWINVLGTRESYSVVVNWRDRKGDWTSLMKRNMIHDELEMVFTFESRHKKLFLKKTNG